MPVTVQYQGKIFFRGGDQGWSEIYYPMGASIGAAAANMLTLLPTRLAILQASCSAVQMEVSQLGLRGDSTVVLGSVSPGTWPSIAGYLSLDVAVLVRYQVGLFTRNKTFLRGIDVLQTDNGNFTPTTPFTALVNTFLNTLLANFVFQLTTINPTPPPARLFVYLSATSAAINVKLARRKAGRPFGLRVGRRIAP